VSGRRVSYPARRRSAAARAADTRPWHRWPTTSTSMTRWPRSPNPAASPGTSRRSNSIRSATWRKRHLARPPDARPAARRGPDLFSQQQPSAHGKSVHQEYDISGTWRTSFAALTYARATSAAGPSQR